MTTTLDTVPILCSSFSNTKHCNQHDSVAIENPATGETTALAMMADNDALERCITMAQLGFKRWQSIAADERGRILHRAAELLRLHNDKLAIMEVKDTGKPISEARTIDIASGADCLAYYAGLCDKLHGLHQELTDGFIYTRQEPLGVCAAIGAWNYPLQIACWKAAPCLAAGNSMIYKPSPLTPHTALTLADILQEAGLPEGVFNVLLGDNDIGQQLVEHPGIKKVSLTGSVETGKKVMAAAGAHIKPCTLELGGKSPLIIFADCNLDKAVQGAMDANFYTQGEVCSNGTRVYVERTIYDAFVRQCVHACNKLVIGDPMNPNTQVGAVISKQHMDRVLHYINSGLQQGARLACGGKAIIVPGCEHGYYIEPSIFIDCNDDMIICQQEIFGPVMCIMPFDSEHEVIERANNSHYGLAAGIYTNDLNKAHRVIAELEAGTCWINSYNVTPISMPFGGFKQSGAGRENGMAAISQYLQVKSIYVARG